MVEKYVLVSLVYLETNRSFLEGLLFLMVFLPVSWAFSLTQDRFTTIHVLVFKRFLPSFFFSKVMFYHRANSREFPTSSSRCNGPKAN